MTNRRAMTLMEMLVILVLFMILGGAVMAISVIGKRAFISAESSVHLQQQVRRALDVMVQELRQGGGTLSAATCTGTQCAFQLNLGYNLAAPCPVNDVCWGAWDAAGVAQAAWAVQYRLSGTQILREILDGNVPPNVQSSRILANNISQLTFTYTGATETVQVQLQAQEVSAQLTGGTRQAAPTPLITTVKLRN